uniref:Thioesterase domain-containing protein n=1 Tax=Panagrolaimus sp. JU765 TaxID=591449 RepID=A0AC34QW66_9BILA
MTGSNKYLPLIKDIYKGYKHATNFSRAAGGCKVVHVSEGKVKLEFEVTEELTNPFGTLHGGCTSTLVDIATTTALLATPRQLPGVTVDLSVSCLSAAKLGETIILDAEVIKSGKSIAFTKAQLYKKSDSTPIATALHTKAFAGQKKSDA